MKNLFMEKEGSLEIRDKQMPEATGDYVVVRIVCCGICGSDVNAYRGGNPTVKYPIDGIGHEGVGIVHSVGKDVKSIAVGDRVALEPYIPDYTCHSCMEERFNNCEHLHVAGVHTDGMMADYYMIKESLVHKIPDSLSFRHAALIEPLTIGLHGTFRANVKKGDIVAVTGAGPIGILASFAVLSKGATPVIMDVLQDRLDYALSLGIPYAFNNSQGGFDSYIEKEFGHLADKMIECTGAPFILANMHDYVRHGGCIALVGWPKAPVTINTVRCMQKELDIHPSRNSNKLFPEATRLIATGFVPVERMITKTVSLEDTEETIKDMIKNPADYVKVVVEI